MTLFRPAGKSRQPGQHRRPPSPEALAFAAGLRASRAPWAEPVSPRPPECREPAPQRPDWWGDLPEPMDPCGNGPAAHASSEDGEQT